MLAQCRKARDEVLGPAGAGFPDQEARPVIWIKLQASSCKLQFRMILKIILN